MRYRRDISYIYSYKYGKRNGNVGFVCMDSREDMCRVNISLKAPYELPAEKLEVYMFVNRKDETAYINIGSFKPLNSMCRYRTVVNRFNFAGSGYSVDETAGVYIISREHPQYVFAATWDGSSVEGMKFSEFAFREQDTNAQSSVIEIIKEYIENEQKEQLC